MRWRRECEQQHLRSVGPWCFWQAPDGRVSERRAKPAKFNSDSPGIYISVGAVHRIHQCMRNERNQCRRLRHAQRGLCHQPPVVRAAHVLQPRCLSIWPTANHADPVSCCCHWGNHQHWLMSDDLACAAGALRCLCLVEIIWEECWKGNIHTYIFLSSINFLDFILSSSLSIWNGKK